MTYLVTLSDEIDLNPETEVAEILQNVRTIIGTRAGEVPLDREFGLSWDMLDKPLPVARTLMIAEVYEKIEMYEPRAEVRSVEFDETIEDAMDGVTKPRVIVAIKNNEEADE